MSHSDSTKTKQMAFIVFYSSFYGRKMLFCIQNDPLILRAVGNNNSMLRSKFLCYLQMPRGAGDTINCQIPRSQDSSCIKCPGFVLGRCSSMEFTRTLPLSQFIGNAYVWDYKCKQRHSVLYHNTR